MTSPTTDRRAGLVGNTPIKAPCACATTGQVTLSGEQVIDGVTTSSSRVLVWKQADATQNGIYDTSSAAWTRSYDANGTYDLVHGTIVMVNDGTSNGGLAFKVTTADPITIGSSQLNFVSTGGFLQGAVASDLNMAGFTIYAIGNGSTTAPALRSNASSNTGVRFPSAGTMALVTGGVDTLYLNATHDVMSGQTTPGLQNLYGFSFVAATGAFTLNHSSAATNGAVYQAFGYNGVQTGAIVQQGTTGIGITPGTNTSLVINGGAVTPPNAIGNSGTAVAVDWSKSNVHTLTMTGNVAAGSFTHVNSTSGQTINIWITQDGTGSRTLGMTGFKNSGHATLVLSTAAGKIDLLTIQNIGGTYFASLQLDFG